MTTNILNSQKDSTGFLNARVQHNPFTPAPPASIGKEAAMKHYYRQASKSAPFGFGETVEVDLPLNSHIADISVQLVLPALTSGNYCSYPALAAIARYELVSGSQTIIPSVSYPEVMKYLIAKRNTKEASAILAAAGGTGFTSGTVVAPIPLFFSKLLAKDGQRMPYFPTHKLENALTLKITMRSAADIAAAGATVGSPALTGKFKIWCAETAGNDSLDNWDTYQSLEFEAKTGTVAATGTTETEVTLDGFIGNINCLSVSNVLASDLSTAHSYFLNQQLDTIRLKVEDNDYFYEAGVQRSADYDSFVLGHNNGNDATLANPYIIPIGIMDDPRVFSGALNMEKHPQLRLFVTHSEGANCQVQVLAVKNVYYKIVNGNLVKSLSP